MIRDLLPLPVIALFLALTLSQGAEAAPPRCAEEDGGGACLWGRVEAFDGQSLQIKGLSLSLAGIQVPERKVLCGNRKTGRAMDCGIFARKRLAELIRGGVACDILDAQGGGLIGTCRAAEGDLSLLLVQAGAARGKDGPYDDATLQAIKEQKGLWGPDVLLPREWEALRARAEKAEKHARGE